MRFNLACFLKSQKALEITSAVEFIFKEAWRSRSNKIFWKTLNKAFKCTQILLHHKFFTRKDSKDFGATSERVFLKSKQPFI